LKIFGFYLPPKFFGFFFSLFLFSFSSWTVQRKPVRLQPSKNPLCGTPPCCPRTVDPRVPRLYPKSWIFWFFFFFGSLFFFHSSFSPPPLSPASLPCRGRIFPFFLTHFLCPRHGQLTLPGAGLRFLGIPTQMVPDFGPPSSMSFPPPPLPPFEGRDVFLQKMQGFPGIADLFIHPRVLNPPLHFGPFPPPPLPFDSPWLPSIMFPALGSRGA